MKAHAALVGRRLALGTWLQLEAWGAWLGGGPDVQVHGFADFLRWAGVVLRRVTASLACAAFYGLLLQRVPGGIYALPLVWVIGAWQMSDTSATPPPEEGRPVCRECAGHELVSVTPLEGQKGMLIYTSAAPDSQNRTHVHIVGEVNEP